MLNLQILLSARADNTTICLFYKKFGDITFYIAKKEG